MNAAKASIDVLDPMDLPAPPFIKSNVLSIQMLSYNRANRAVALLCNHQRAVPKTHDTSMAHLQAKIEKKEEEVKKAEKEYKAAKKEKKGG